MPALKDMVPSPTEYFERPADVVVDDTLTDMEKKAILDAWERDQVALDISADEGMLPEPGETSDHDAIKKAIKVVDNA